MSRYEPKPDYWFFVITRLERVMSLKELGRRVDCSAASLCRYKSGISEPRWSVARMLIALDEFYVIRSANETPPVAKSV